MSCYDLIDSCMQCEGRGDEHNDAYVYLGEPPAERPNQDRFVTCTMCYSNQFYD